MRTKRTGPALRNAIFDHDLKQVRSLVAGAKADSASTSRCDPIYCIAPPPPENKSVKHFRDMMDVLEPAGLVNKNLDYPIDFWGTGLIDIETIKIMYEHDLTFEKVRSLPALVYCILDGCGDHPHVNEPCLRNCLYPKHYCSHCEDIKFYMAKFNRQTSLTRLFTFLIAIGKFDPRCDNLLWNDMRRYPPMRNSWYCEYPKELKDVYRKEDGLWHTATIQGGTVHYLALGKGYFPAPQILTDFVLLGCSEPQGAAMELCGPFTRSNLPQNRTSFYSMAEVIHLQQRNKSGRSILEALQEGLVYNSWILKADLMRISAFLSCVPNSLCRMIRDYAGIHSNVLYG